jgi:hypothetical protein
MQVHHRDHDTTNGVIENLGWLCHHCNLLEAHLWGLQEKGRITVESRPGAILVCFTRSFVSSTDDHK